MSLFCKPPERMEPLFGQMLSAWLEDTRLRVKRSTHATYRGGRSAMCAPVWGGFRCHL